MTPEELSSAEDADAAGVGSVEFCADGCLETKRLVSTLFACVMSVRCNVDDDEVLYVQISKRV